MIEIIINDDGSVMIPKGTAQENQAIKSILNGLADDTEISNFLDSNESEKIFGDEFLCG